MSQAPPRRDDAGQPQRVGHPYSMGKNACSPRSSAARSILVGSALAFVGPPPCESIPTKVRVSSRTNPAGMQIRRAGYLAPTGVRG
jgi:hypothetical protein